MPKQYKHIFFDLDKTLWDYDRNSEEALKEIYITEKLEEKYNLKMDSFIEEYNRINILMWQYHREGKVNKETLRSKRFVMTLDRMNVKNDELATRLNEQYIHSAMGKKHLMPHTVEVLDYLIEKYKLHVITNGFEESQKLKLANSGIDKYFVNIVTCESAGCTKPDRRIFEYSLRLSGAKRQHSLMVGDHLEVDIAGARRVGMDQVYVSNLPLNQRVKITYHISSLLELKKIL